MGFNYESEIAFYTRYGDVFAWMCVWITLLLAVFAMLKIYQPPDSVEPPAESMWRAKSSGVRPAAGGKTTE